MRLRLDDDRCTGHGRCYSLAPELFGPDDAGQSVLLSDDDLTEEQVPAARLAVSSCPEYAINLIADEGSVS